MGGDGEGDADGVLSGVEAPVSIVPRKRKIKICDDRRCRTYIHNLGHERSFPPSALL
jgi:hypothetical protein